MGHLLIFAGTTEGRLLAKKLDQARVSADVCVATEYGKELVLESSTGHRVHAGRLDEPQMVALMKECGATEVVDATHPYAVLVSENIHQASDECGCRYLRLLRESDDLSGEENLVIVDSVEEAVHYLEGVEGNILAATGSKELQLYTRIPDYEHRVTARVLSTKESVDHAARLGFRGKNLICMQGPFSEEMNAATLQMCHASWLVTKESGKTGGFPEKLSAARKAGATLVVVGRPPQEEGYTLAQILDILGIPDRPEEKTDGQDTPASNAAVNPRTVYVIGIGMGRPDGMTVEAENAVIASRVLIGADRMLRCAREMLLRAETTEQPQIRKEMVAEYLPDRIRGYLDDHPAVTPAAVLLSGDVGFYSGAKKLVEKLDGYDVRVICGISSVVYLCGRLNTSWEDVKLVSLHGREQNLIAAVREHKKVFVLTGKKDSFEKMCRNLVLYGLGHVLIHAGSNLSYPDECIVTGTAEEYAGEVSENSADPLRENAGDGAVQTEQAGAANLLAQVSDLAASLIENPQAAEMVTHGLADESFLRSNVPMTKEEVRAVSLSKMRLHSDSIVYDVGAGTGSVSVEMALRARDGMVFAIEKKPEAVDLIRANAVHLGTPNLKVVEGLAPEALEDLPAPTHAFIGGSSGNLKEIIALLLQKNPACRIVINAIALETVGEAMQALAHVPVTDVDIACVNVSKSKSVARYHMMMGQNPVYVISFTGRE